VIDDALAMKMTFKEQPTICGLPILYTWQQPGNLHSRCHHTPFEFERSSYVTKNEKAREFTSPSLWYAI
jgi:hypothetical protein